MLGMFSLFPFLKGWEYKTHDFERIVRRGATPLEMPITETGWVLGLGELTDDAYGTTKVYYQGAGLETSEFIFNPELFRAQRSFIQDPAGWIPRYTRPNPASTAGLYLVSAFSGGFQGSAWPYVPTIKIQISLLEESTQEEAYIFAEALVIAVTDKRAFIRSLRRVLDAKASLNIDPALLVPGPGEFKELKS